MKKLAVSISLIIVPVLIFGFLGKIGEMGISLLAGFICAVLINIDRFDSFKAGEIEAKMRQASEVIKDANATIEQLKEIAEPLMNYNLAHLVEGDSILGVGSKYKEDLYKNLKKNFELFGIQNKKNEELLQAATRNITRLHLYEIVIELEHWFEQKEISEIKKNLMDYADLNTPFPSGEDIRELFKSSPSLKNVDIEKRIKGYEKFTNQYLKESSR